jgi:class 3 adenylate cyclase
MTYRAKILAYFGLGILLYGLILAGTFLFHNRVEDLARQKLQGQEEQEIHSYVSKLKIGPKIAGSEARIQAIERGFQPFLSRLKSRLRRGDTGNLAELSLPFSEHSAWIVARKSRIISKAGKSFDDLFNKGWSRHFFMGLHHGGEVFKRKITQFYPRPISFRDFMSYRAAFQPLRLKHRSIAWYLGQTGNYSFLILVDLDSLGTDSLREKILNLIQKKYASPRASSDLLQGYFEFFGDRLGYFLGYLLLLWWVCSRAWPLLWETQFSARYLLVFLSFLIALDGFFIHLFQEFQENSEVQAVKHLERRWRSKILEVERGLDLFLQAHAKEMSRNFKRGASLKSHDWPSFAKLILADREGGVSILPKDTEPLYQRMMVYCIVELIPVMEEARSPDVAKVRKKFSRWRGDIMSFREKSWDELRNAVLGRSAGVFHRNHILSSSYYLFWQHRGVAENFRVLGAWCRTQDVLEAYFQSLSRKAGRLGHLDAVLALSNSGEGRFSLGKPLPENDFDVQDLMFLLQNKKTLFQNVFWKGKSRYALSTLSPVFQGYNFLFLIDKDFALSEIKVLWGIFFWLQILFILLAILSFLVLTRRVLGPVSKLRKGLSQIERQDLDFSLDSAGKDEISQVLSGFNSMVLELRRRKQLLPFVAHDILRLFKSESGQLETRISDQAVVVFADLRSFTTISETYEPEEIVTMLNDYFSIWQERVQRYGGVIEKFMGDAVVVIFFKRNSPHYIHHALQTSIEVMREVKQFNQEREKRGLFTISNGVGISEGRIDFGIIGNESKRHFSASGVPVIRAEELEAESKHGRYTHILTDATTQESLRHQYDFIPHKKLQDAPVFEVTSL